MKNRVKKQIAPPGDITQPEATTRARNATLRHGLDCLVEEALPHEFGLYKGRDVAAALMAEFAPRDGSEELLVAQIVAIDFAVLDGLKRARAFEVSPQVRDMELRHVEKLSNTSLRLRDAFDRRRAPGPGNVSVNTQVNVAAGGQALVAMQPQLPAGTEAEDPDRGSPERRKPREKSPPAFDDERIKRPPPPPDDE